MAPISKKNNEIVSLREDWGTISRKRCIIRSWCQQMTYRKPPKLYALSSGQVTFDDTAWHWKVKGHFGFVRSAISAQAQFLLLCPALSYSALSWGTKKWAAQ